MISIIGAGPAGSYTAYCLAKKNYDVSLFEEHNQVGIPIQCTGLVTDSITELIKVNKEIVINKLPIVKIFSPNGKCLEINFKKPNILFHRAKFDQHVAQLAADAGAKLNTSHKFIDYKNNEILFENGKKVKSDVLIGADGPASPVARSAGMYKNRKFVAGVQARYNIEVQPDAIEFWIGPGYFAWVVPESNKEARIGLVESAGLQNPNNLFKSFLKKRVPNVKFLEHQSGTIPVYDPRVLTKKDNVYLVGDSATMVKATTYGGIIQGMVAGEELANSIMAGSDYESMWKKKIGTELYLHLIMRNTLDKFSEKDCNELINLSSNEKIRALLENFDRDYPSRFIFKMLLNEPRLIKYGIKAIA